MRAFAAIFCAILFAQMGFAKEVPMKVKISITSDGGSHELTATFEILK